MTPFAVVMTAGRDDAKGWYARLLGRPADLEPMAEVAEWHFGTSAVQLVEDPKRAGGALLTLIVDDIDAERERLSVAGLQLGEASGGDFATVAQITDPEGNVITFAQPGPAQKR